MKLTGKIAPENLKDLDTPQLSDGHRSIPRIWVLVADEHVAKIFRKKGKRLELLGESRMMDTDTHLANKTIGRVTSSRSNAMRHKYEPRMKALHQQETSFAHQLAGWLDAAVQENAFDRLVLTAPPRMLGDLRKTLSKRVCQRIVAELNKELTKHSEPALRQELADVIIF